jgi:hypothetical protein
MTTRNMVKKATKDRLVRSFGDRRLQTRDPDLAHQTTHLVWVFNESQLFCLDLANPDQSHHEATAPLSRQSLHDDTSLASSLIDMVQAYAKEEPLPETHDLVAMPARHIPDLGHWQGGTAAWDQALAACGALDQRVRDLFFYSLGLLIDPRLIQVPTMMHTWIGDANLQWLFGIFRSLFEPETVWHPDAERDAFPFANLSLERGAGCRRRAGSMRGMRFWWTSDLSLLTPTYVAAMVARDRMVIRLPYEGAEYIEWDVPGVAILAGFPDTKAGQMHKRSCWGFDLRPAGPAGRASQRSQLPTEAQLLRELPAVLHRAVVTVAAFQQEIAEVRKGVKWNYDNATHIWFRRKYGDIPDVVMPPFNDADGYSCGRCICCHSPEGRARVIADAEEMQQQRRRLALDTSSSDMLDG